jgi:DNA mismatch endonuclease (patch repair protein)
VIENEDADPPPSPERRALMARIRGKHTRPELVVRRLLHAMGYRFRLHRRDLPGTPDIALVARRKVVLVHGCFWHRHPGCKAAAKVPRTRTAFWEGKFARNVARDAAKLEALAGLGWTALVLWECELRGRDEIAGRLRAFLGPPGGARAGRVDTAAPPAQIPRRPGGLTEAA